MVARSVSPMVVAAASTVDVISHVSPTSIPLVSHGISCSLDFCLLRITYARIEFFFNLKFDSTGHPH